MSRRGRTPLIPKCRRTAGRGMSYCVFMHRADSIYDDSPAEQYQFPKSYLSRAEGCVGDWIVYLEPTKVAQSRGYFAIARVQQIIPDPKAPDMFLAIILTDQQMAEVKRFVLADYDVVLGMLERRIDGQADINSRVRSAIKECIKAGRQGSRTAPRAAPIHRDIERLSDRGGASAVVTTNFDLLLEQAARLAGRTLQTYSLNSIPRPTRRPNFSGAFHIHGALESDKSRISDLIITDQDFGDAYLRQRTVPDFIYDLTRLYHLVLVGYSASDPPMKYLLNAIASDENRFSDIKKRYVFTPSSAPDPVTLADWRARGILPIEYNSDNGHDALRATLSRWAQLSMHNGRRALVEAELRRIVKKPRSSSEVSDQDLFDHLFRRDPGERAKLSAFVSKQKADISWLDAIASVCREHERGRRP
jgi:hypothetical protein